MSQGQFEQIRYQRVPYTVFYEWTGVDCLEGAVDKPARFEEQASQPIQYVLAFLTSKT